MSPEYIEKKMIDYRPYVVKVLRKGGIKECDIDDVVGEVYLRFARCFDPSGGYQPQTYLIKLAYGSAKEWKRRNGPFTRSGVPRINSVSLNGFDYEDVRFFAFEDTDTKFIGFKDDLLSCLESETKTVERYVLALIELDCCADVAKRFGVTRGAVSQSVATFAKRHPHLLEWLR